MYAAAAAVNDNRLVWGITALLFNIGQRHVFSDLGKVHEHLLTRPLVKLVVVMSMFFMFTRDIAITLCLTAIYFVVFVDMLHENGRLSVVPRYVRDAIQRSVRMQEYVRARDIVRAYEAGGGSGGAAHAPVPAK
jgi:hypothetical protein